jgi:hypothetical protein
MKESSLRECPVSSSMIRQISVLGCTTAEKKGDCGLGVRICGFEVLDANAPKDAIRI